MSDMNTMNTLMHGALGLKVPTQFAAEEYDYEAALRDEMRKMLCDENGQLNRYKFERNKYDLFELMSQTLDEVLPQNIQNALDMFTETIRVPQGSRLEFRRTLGKQRGKQFVTRATTSGNYETFRLDHESFDVYPQAIGGAGYVNFERYLDGLESMADIYEVIQAGITDRIFEMVQGCLLSSWNDTGRPAVNKVTATNFDATSMQKLCNVVAAYGTPAIYCSPEFAAEMCNAITYNDTTKIAPQDLIDIREQGYVGKFHGVPVIVMPQSFTDETNTKLVMNPSFAYVLPSSREKIVKLGFEGNSYFREWDNHIGDNGIELQGYLKCGVGLVTTANCYGIYYNSGIDAGSWKEYNETITAG